jgi:2-haloalkanoic acid dehalogenase type II
LEFARLRLANSTSEAAIYGFVHAITAGNIVVNRDNYVVLPYSLEASVESRLASIEARTDAVRGLERMKKNYVLATLSNGNVSLLVEMAKNAELPWDAALSAELFHHFKPDREVYLGAADMLGCKPAEVMMVAAHPGDLRAAQACGLRTAFVARPLENGPFGQKRDPCVHTSSANNGAPRELPC